MNRQIVQQSSSLPKATHHRLIIGDCQSMTEIPSDSIQLVVTSPPYYNAPHDYDGMFSSYEKYLSFLENVAKELWRVTKEGRIVALVIDDMLVDGVRYPIVADTVRIFQEIGFRNRDRIVWEKPDGYAVRSRRSGNLRKFKSPMYYYSDNLVEEIRIFQKGEFDYKSIPDHIREASKLDWKEVESGKWYWNVWKITNVLPNAKLEKGIAAFPDEIPYRLIKLCSFVGETVLDCFAGSGTSMKIARQLGRNSVGFEIRPELEPVIREKVGFARRTVGNGSDTFDVVLRADIPIRRAVSVVRPVTVTSQSLGISFSHRPSASHRMVPLEPVGDGF